LLYKYDCLRRAEVFGIPDQIFHPGIFFLCWQVILALYHADLKKVSLPSPSQGMNLLTTLQSFNTKHCTMVIDGSKLCLGSLIPPSKSEDSVSKMTPPSLLQRYYFTNFYLKHGIRPVFRQTLSLPQSYFIYNTCRIGKYNCESF
jgi:hypothetical protein